MTRLWGWIAAAFGFLLAALLFVAGQRDRARETARRAQREAQAREAISDAERAVERARAQAREKSSEVQREHDDHKSAGTRPAVFGDQRLHHRRDD